MRHYAKNGSHFRRKGFLLNAFGEMCFLEESYKKMQTNSNSEIFESALYMKSGSKPLNQEYSFTCLQTCFTICLLGTITGQNFFSKDDGHIVPWIVIIVPPVNTENSFYSNSSFYSHSCSMICPHPSHNLCTLNMIKMWRTYVWSCMPTLPHTVSFHLNVSVYW